MATKEEIREWLECCGAERQQIIAYANRTMDYLGVIRIEGIDYLDERDIPLHLLNETLTGIQGPTFAEWKKAKGREGKILKIMDAYNEDSLYGHMGPAMAAKILDAIEGEGE